MSWFKSKEIQLINEIQNGDIAKVTKLINSGANINYRQEEGQMAPLDCAVINGNIELVKLLVSKGATINNVTKNGYSALMLATMQIDCKLELIDTLINNGADVNAQSHKERWSPLLLASSNVLIDVAVIKRLIEAGALIDNSNIFGMTPLMYFAEFGDDDIVNYLLGKGANPNSSNSNGLTPLHFAACSNRDAFVASFKESVEMVSKMYNLVVNFYEGSDSIAGNFSRKNPTIRPKVIKLLLEHGANINCTTNNGAAPLTLAIVANNTVIAETLIHEGADVHTTVPPGLNALHLAAREGNNRIINLLLENGLNVNSSTIESQGETALMTAVWKGNTSTVKLLIEKGADVKAQTTTGENAVRWAVHKKHVEILTLLVEAGAD